jgi:hypothetical protein
VGGGGQADRLAFPRRLGGSSRPHHLLCGALADAGLAVVRSRGQRPPGRWPVRQIRRRLVRVCGASYPSACARRIIRLPPLIAAPRHGQRGGSRPDGRGGGRGAMAQCLIIVQVETQTFARTRERHATIRKTPLVPGRIHAEPQHATHARRGTLDPRPLAPREMELR